jgi:hypothetical protein
MNVGSNVVVTWGTYKGSKGIITTLNGKNVTVKLDQGFEIALSIEHIEEAKQMLIIDKIEQLFGDNYLIKSKKVLELVQTELTEYKVTNPHGYDIHYFTTNKTHRVQGHEFQTYLKATLNSKGVWWIQQG